MPCRLPHKFLVHSVFIPFSSQDSSKHANNVTVKTNVNLNQYLRKTKSPFLGIEYTITSLWWQYAIIPSCLAIARHHSAMTGVVLVAMQLDSLKHISEPFFQNSPVNQATKGYSENRSTSELLQPFSNWRFMNET